MMTLKIDSASARFNVQKLARRDKDPSKTINSYCNICSSSNHMVYGGPFAFSMGITIAFCRFIVGSVQGQFYWQSFKSRLGVGEAISYLKV
jgi:hypothetical protein